jgi:hypothetical protein
LVPLLAAVEEISQVSIVLVCVRTQLAGREVPDSNPSDKYCPKEKEEYKKVNNNNKVIFFIK